MEGYARSAVRTTGTSGRRHTTTQHDGDHDQEADDDLRSRLVADVVLGLPARLRNVFVMSTLLRKSRAEIAAELGISVRRVDKYMTKALVTCRERLLAQGIDLAAGG
ncbi:MAG: sigma factor-like helix-turn-helix DNA-binding protein [Steroidobacteraceae bacterium]